MKNITRNLFLCLLLFVSYGDNKYIDIQGNKNKPGRPNNMVPINLFCPSTTNTPTTQSQPTEQPIRTINHKKNT